MYRALISIPKIKHHHRQVQKVTLKHLVFKTNVQKYRIDEFIKKYSIFIDKLIKTTVADLGEDIVNKIIPHKKRPRKRKLTNVSQVKKNARKVKSNISTGYFNADSIFF